MRKKLRLVRPIIHKRLKEAWLLSAGHLSFFQRVQIPKDALYGTFQLHPHRNFVGKLSLPLAERHIYITCDVLRRLPRRHEGSVSPMIMGPCPIPGKDEQTKPDQFPVGISKFLLSSAEDPLHATSLITVEGYTDYRAFDTYTVDVQRSLSVTLQAGRKYYFEVLHKEAGGGDNVSVAWTIPTSTDYPFEPRKVIDGRYLSPYRGDLALQKRLASGQSSPVLPGSDVSFALELFNQATTSAKNVTLVDTMPEGFELSPLDNNGWQAGYRFVRFQALSEAGNRGPWASMAELGLLDSAGEQMSKNKWRISYFDSTQSDAPADYAIDGNPSTIWHTKWSPSSDPFPHEIQVDLGELVMPGGFTYLPRPGGGNGTVGNYDFAVSIDGTQWITVASGTFADNALTKTVTFTAPAPNQLLLTVAGPLAPGESQIAKIVLRSAITSAFGSYQNRAEIVNAWDGVDSLIYDGDSTYDSNVNNDVLVDDVLNNAAGDEDDSDVATIELAAATPTPTNTPTPTATNTPDPSYPTPTPPVTPTATSTPDPSRPTPTVTQTPTATNTPISGTGTVLPTATSIPTLATPTPPSGTEQAVYLPLVSR